MASRVAIKTVNNLHQHYELTCALEVLSLNACPLQPLSAVYNGKYWSASGDVINYKNTTSIQLGNKDDMIDIIWNMYNNKSRVVIPQRKLVLEELYERFGYYNTYLEDVMVIDGISRKKSKHLTYKFQKIISDRVSGSTGTLTDKEASLIEHVDGITNSLLYSKKHLQYGCIQRSLSHIAIQKIICDVLYKNDIDSVIALYISNHS